MGGRVVFAWLGAWGMLALAQDADGVLERVRARMHANLEHIPDYVCRQTVERSERSGAGASFRQRDLLRVDVGVAGNRELYAWPDSGSLGEQELAAMVGSGVVGTGQFAIFARHIFSAGVAEFTARGEEMREGRRTYRFDYEVPRESSAYRLRVPPHQDVVGFHGSFWADAGTLDLVRLEVEADDIPARLGMVEARTAVDYQRAAIGGSTFLLPKHSELLLVSASGLQSLNRSEFSACRRYQALATLSFDENSADRADVPRQAGPPAPSPAQGLPERALLEITLAGDIEPETAAAGDPVPGVLAHPLKDGDRVIAPEGAVLYGRLLSIEKRSLPISHYVVTLQFHTIEWGGTRKPFSATMEEAAPTAGLIRPEKRLNPTFSRDRNARLTVLVGGQQPGEGVLHWDARRPHIAKGLRMKWRVDARTP